MVHLGIIAGAGICLRKKHQDGCRNEISAFLCRSHLLAKFLPEFELAAQMAKLSGNACVINVINGEKIVIFSVSLRISY